MILLAVVLAQTVAAPAPSPAVGLPEAIRVGAPFTGSLPCRLENARNVARRSFALELESPGPITITLESLDFNAQLFVRDPNSVGEESDSRSWHDSDAWLVHEAKAAGPVLVEVASEDEHGGEFTLAVRAGRFPPPRGIDRLREVVDSCEAIAKRAEAHGDATRCARFLGQASRTACAIENFERARSLAEAQLEKARSAGLADEGLQARRNLGAAERRLGHVDRAQDLAQAALDETERALTGAKDSARAAELALLAATLCDDLGDIVRERKGPAEAVPWRERALTYLARANRPDLESIGLCRLGDELSDLGEIARARETLEKGLAAAVKSKSAPGLASALLSSGRFHEKHGSAIKAREQCERALTLDPIPALRLEIQGTLANALIDLGQYERAAAALDEVETLASRAAPGVYEIPIRVTRARIAFDVRDLARARASLEEALALQEASGSPLHRVDILLELGLVLDELGRVDDARARYEEALDECERSGDLERQARILIDLGVLHEKHGKADDALKSYTHAEEVARSAGSATLEAFGACGRAYALYLGGKLAESKELAKLAAAKLESLGELRSAVDAQDTLARIGLDTGDLVAVDDALCVADRLLQAQDEQHLDRFAAAGLRSSNARWGEFAQDLVARRAKAETLAAAERDALVREGWRTAGRWKGRVLLESMRARRGSDPGAEAALPGTGGHAVTVEYVAGRDDLFAYVATAGALRLVDLGPRAPIEESARRFVDAIASRTTPPEKFATQGTWLYERLVAPAIADLPDDVVDLAIVPTPELSILPFEALVRPPRPEAVERAAEIGFDRLDYLIDRFCVTYAPSAPVLAELQSRAPRSGEKRFLVLGDPVYAGEATPRHDDELALARPAGASDYYQRLPSTKDEAVAVARILLFGDAAEMDAKSSSFVRLEHDRSGSLPAARFDLHLGADARTDVLRQDLRAYSTLHIAAHGHVDPDDPRRSGLVLSYEPANQGLFSLEEVLGMRLDAELVVLSACDTARGRIVGGEGVQSLAHAFLDAGSRSVIATLWELKDSTAADVMKRFYALHLEEHAHPARALRAAKLEFRHSQETRGKSPSGSGVARIAVSANPYYWAPFVYAGRGAE